MLRAIRRALFGPPSPPPEPFSDPVLGELQPAELGWTVSVTVSNDSFEITVGGREHPDEPLLGHARDIVSDYEAFKRAVQECIERESCNYPDDVRAELDQLEVDSISLFWPDRPDDGMIFFRGPADDLRSWRCDYIARKPTGLGFDT